MSAWHLLAATPPGAAQFVADTPGRAPASSAPLLAALPNEDEASDAAAAELAALVAEPQAAAEPLSPRVATALQQLPLPPFLIDRTALSVRNPHNAGRQPVFQGVLDLAREAAAAGTPLPPVRPCAVIRIPHPTSPEGRRLLRRYDHFLRGTAQAPLPEAVQQARKAEVERFRAGVAAAAQHITDPHDKALLQLLHRGSAYLEPLCCFETLRAVLEVPAAAEIRLAGCLGPATSAAAASLARVLALGAGDHKRRLALPQATEVLSAIKRLAQVGDLSPLGPLLGDVRVRFKSPAKMFQPFQEPMPCNDVLHISKQKAAHSSDRDLLGGLTKPGFVALLCISLSPSTLKDMGMGCRDEWAHCEIHLGKDDTNHITALARVLCGEEGDTYDQLVAEFDASPTLMRLLKTVSKKLAVVHQIFCGVPLSAADKLPILRLMRTEEGAKRFYLDGLAGELGLVQLRFLTLHALSIGLSRAGQWPPIEPILPGGAAACDAARLEVLGMHNLPEDVWTYGEEDWQLVALLPLRYRTPAEAIVLDMQTATRPRCYGLRPTLDHITKPGCRLSEEEWDTLCTHMAAVLLARYQGILVADVQASLGADAAAALLGSPAALEALAAIDQLCSEWLPEGDMHVSATQLQGRRLFCVPGDDICQLPEAGTYLGWAVELERPGVLAALSGRFAPDVEKRRRELAKRPKPPAAAAAALPAASEHGAAAAAATGGGSAALGLADVGPRPEAALHNATEAVLARFLAMTGQEDGPQVAATLMQLLSSNADDVLQSGRVSDDAIYEAFRHHLPPGLPRPTAMARMRAAQPSIMDKSLSQQTKQPVGGQSWAAARDEQIQAALQAMQQKSGGTQTGVHMLRRAAAAAATAQQQQQRGAATPADLEEQQEGGEDAAEEDDDQVGQRQQAAAEAAAASDAEAEAEEEAGEESEEESEEEAESQQQDSQDENLPQEPHRKRQRTEQTGAAAAGGACARPVLGQAQQQQQQQQQRQGAPHVAPAAFQVPRPAVDVGGGCNSGGQGRGSGGGSKRPTKTLGPARRTAAGV